MLHKMRMFGCSHPLNHSKENVITALGGLEVICIYKNEK